jgi:hypothetical protein
VLVVKLTFYGGVNEIGGDKILFEDKKTRIFDFGVRALDASKKLIENPVIIDGKRMLDAKDFKGAYFYGIVYRTRNNQQKGASSIENSGNRQ